MELHGGNDNTDYEALELPLERAGDPDTTMMSTGKPVLKEEMREYQDRVAAAAAEHEFEDHHLGKIVGLSAVGIGLGIFAYVKYKGKHQ